MDKKECIKNAINLLVKSLVEKENYLININLEYAHEGIVEALTKDVNK